jgi:zinc finger protein CreA/MIG
VAVYDTQFSRRSHSSSALAVHYPQPQPDSYASAPASAYHLPSTSAFNTLSSVAMDELYELEQQEARRRAEYQARHAEALRRAEFGLRFDPEHISQTGWARLSKSATTSPVISPSGSTGAIDGVRFKGVSNYRAGREDIDEHLQRERGIERSRRRLSGPAWATLSAAPPSQTLASPTTRNVGLTHSRSSGHLPVRSHSSGHLVDPAAYVPGSAHHSPAWGHPYRRPRFDQSARRFSVPNKL